MKNRGRRIMDSTNSNVHITETSRDNTYEYLKHIGEPIPKSKLVWKRLLDILFGVIGLIISTPFILVFGIIIKLTSPGPVFFKQERVGYMGKNFKVIKLRSMRNDAEAKTGAVWAKKNDPRVTPVGRFMRKTRIDEMPQFWNVLKGDMSLVGTRPPTVDEYEKYSYHHKARLATKPGITGMWQVSGRSNITNFEDIVELDTEYITNWSLALDIQILIKTVKAVLKKEGAE